jgi:hypothetical protein
MDVIYANIYYRLLIEQGRLDEAFADKQVGMMTALLDALAEAP